MSDAYRNKILSDIEMLKFAMSKPRPPPKPKRTKKPQPPKPIDPRIERRRLEEAQRQAKEAQKLISDERFAYLICQILKASGKKNIKKLVVNKKVFLYQSSALYNVTDERDPEDNKNMTTKNYKKQTNDFSEWMMETIEKNIEIDENGCWNWKKAKNKQGYGVSCIPKRFSKKKTTSSHRMVYFFFNPSEDKSKYICHKCDNPSCINPDHLFAGTNADNMRDMKEKGRAQKGEKNHCSVLTDKQVLEIRNLYQLKEGKKRVWTQQALAKEYQVSQFAICCILNGETWNHVGGPINDEQMKSGKRKPVICYDMETRNKVASYNGVAEAARAVEASRKSISHAANQPFKYSACGHYWAFESADL